MPPRACTHYAIRTIAQFHIIMNNVDQLITKSINNGVPPKIKRVIIAVADSNVVEGSTQDTSVTLIGPQAVFITARNPIMKSYKNPNGANSSGALPFGYAP